YSAAVFRNEGLRVAVFTTRIVELETRSAGHPDGRNGLVVERGGEFIESRDAASPQRNQGINSDVEDAGRLPHARLRSGAAYSIGISRVARRVRSKRRRRAEETARLAVCPAKPAGHFYR